MSPMESFFSVNKKAFIKVNHVNGIIVTLLRGEDTLERGKDNS